MDLLLKFLFLYDADEYRHHNPKPLFLVIGIIWIILCALCFVHEKEMTFGGMVCFAVMSLWIFIRMGNYRGRYRPKLVPVVRILWLPMLALFAGLALTGNF